MPAIQNLLAHETLQLLVPGFLQSEGREQERFVRVPSLYQVSLDFEPLTSFAGPAANQSRNILLPDDAQ
jgi:hypothetical protein